MTCVADALAERGFSVELVAADAALDTHCANMFVMCGTAVRPLTASPMRRARGPWS
jgi:hypothetical protein